MWPLLTAFKQEAKVMKYLWYRENKTTQKKLEAHDLIPLKYKGQPDSFSMIISWQALLDLACMKC